MKQIRIILISLLCLAAPLHADVKRESRHFLTTELGVGYSALLNKSSIGASSGLAGGKLQVGYEWRYRKFIMHTGVEFAMLSNKTKVNPFLLEAPYTIGLPAGMGMVQHFDFQTYSVTQLMGQVNIPIQAGAVFADRYYFLAGARIGLPLMHSAATTAQVNTYLTDPFLIGQINGVPAHDTGTTLEKANGNWAANILNAQLSAEFGLILNSFWEKPAPRGRKAPQQPQKKPILYRVGVFADYGLLSCAKPSAGTMLVKVSEPRTIQFNDYFAAANTKVNSLLVGIKFAVLFQLNEVKPAKPLPSYLDIYVTDLETSQPVRASLNIYDEARKRTIVREAPGGHSKYRTKPGDYTVTASNDAYYSDTQDATIDGEGVTETVRIALRAKPKPKPVVVDTPMIDIPIVVGAKVVLHNLFFATNQTAILPQSEPALHELAAFMDEHPQVVVRITGHTDDVGSDQANQRLSEGRANAVRNELIKRGVAPERIEADGKGESEPIAPNTTEEGRAKNRRVEFTIIATGEELIEQVKE